MPDLPPVERSKPQLTEALKKCESWPEANWTTDQELAKFIGKAKLAHADCEHKHSKMVELYLKEFE